MRDIYLVLANLYPNQEVFSSIANRVGISLIVTN